MKEFLRPLLISAAFLALPPTEGRATSPDSNSSPEVKAAVGLVEALVEKRTIDALFRLNPHLSSESSLRGSARLTREDEDVLEWLRASTPSFKGCKVKEGVNLGNLQVQVNFEKPCGDKAAYGVDVPLTHGPEGNLHPTGEFTLLTAEGGD